MKLSVPEWCCAIRYNDNSSGSILNDTDAEFVVIKNSLRYWCADPFLFKYKDKYYLFFEMFDRLKRKGLLGYREISETYIGKMKVIYECDTHLSYPFIYEKDGKICIIPESNDSKELFYLVCKQFPSKWEKESVILNEHLVDTTLYNNDGTTFYISEKIINKGVFDRVDLYYEESGKVVECKSNPVKVDATTARGAGKIFNYNGNLIRPSQNCGKSYGEKLNFNIINELTKESFSEVIFKTVSVDEIKVKNKEKFNGIHTYNKIDNLEVIDLKISSNFNVLNVIGGVLKRLKLLW